MPPVARRQRKPTMSDVARLAGVSQATVSMVVNQRDVEFQIAGRTKAKVLAAIDELGFRPNLAARGLRLQRSRTFGLLTDHIASSPFAGRTVLGAQQVAWDNDHLLLMVNTSADPAMEVSAVEALIDRGVDGLLYAAMSLRKLQPPPLLTSLPVVLVNCWADPELNLPQVTANEVSGGRYAAQEVLDAGHRRIAFLGGSKDFPATIERERGFRLALAEARVGVREDWVRYGDYGIHSGYDLTALVIDAHPADERPTALVCGNDRMAAGAVLALKDRRLSVPHDVSIMGYDDQEDLAEEFTPPMSTVSLPHLEMGRAGVELLLALLAGLDDSDPRPLAHRRQSIEGALVRRGSVAAPPRRGPAPDARRLPPTPLSQDR